MARRLFEEAGSCEGVQRRRVKPEAFVELHHCRAGAAANRGKPEPAQRRKRSCGSATRLASSEALAFAALLQSILGSLPRRLAARHKPDAIGRATSMQIYRP